MVVGWLVGQVPLPVGVSGGVKEARPRLYLLVVLKGTDLDLDLPATDYYQLPTDDTPHEWWVCRPVSQKS